MNTYIAIGNIGADPVLKRTRSGKPVLNMSLAVDRKRATTDDQGNVTYVSETDWVPLTIFGSKAENCAKYLCKGAQVAIEGELRNNNYTDSNGVHHKTFEIIVSSIKWLHIPNRTEHQATA